MQIFNQQRAIIESGPLLPVLHVSFFPPKRVKSRKGLATTCEIFKLYNKLQYSAILDTGMEHHILRQIGGPGHPSRFTGKFKLLTVRKVNKFKLKLSQYAQSPHCSVLRDKNCSCMGDIQHILLTRSTELPQAIWNLGTPDIIV